MAHILVYVQRTPHGIHPASAVALCLARDLGSDFGATITAVCPGDAGKANYKVSRAAGRFGADNLLFAGPTGLGTLQKRLNPGLVLTPWTAEGVAIAEDLEGGPEEVRAQQGAHGERDQDRKGQHDREQAAYPAAVDHVGAGHVLAQAHEQVAQDIRFIDRRGLVGVERFRVG